MPSMLHEALIEVFRARPALAAELLRDALRLPLPAFTEIRTGPTSLGDLRRVQHRADFVVQLMNGGAPVLAIVIEVQIDRDPEKWFSWPFYVAGVRAKLRCETCLLVVAPSSAVAAWCGRSIATGHPGWAMRPIVLGPAGVPIVTDATVACRMPEVALLSVVAHGRTEHGLAIALAVLKAADGLDDARKTLYADLTYTSVNTAARRALEAMMKSGYQFQSDFAKTYFGKGRAEGEATGMAQAVLEVLTARGVRVTKSARAQVLGCSDVEVIRGWLQRALVVTRASEMFEEPAS
jgi:hypothetical protein